MNILPREGAVDHSCLKMTLEISVLWEDPNLNGAQGEGGGAISGKAWEL